METINFEAAMTAKLHTLAESVTLLRKHYGAPEKAPTADPFELVLWENVAYLAPRARRQEAFDQLKSTIGTSPDAILAARKSALEHVTAHGILKADFAEKLRACARIVKEEFAGDLDGVVRGPLDSALKALRLFPGIGEPGAEKILLFSGIHPFLAADSNGVRVMVRLGLVEEGKSYARTYAACRTASAGLTRSLVKMQDAHHLLQQHGQTLCKRTMPRCGECPLAAGCGYEQLAANR